jgi:hypothetical protein
MCGGWCVCVLGGGGGGGNHTPHFLTQKHDEPARATKKCARDNIKQHPARRRPTASVASTGSEGVVGVDREMVCVAKQLRADEIVGASQPPAKNQPPSGWLSIAVDLLDGGTSGVDLIVCLFELGPFAGRELDG